jgi:hypothetical protein
MEDTDKRRGLKQRRFAPRTISCAVGVALLVSGRFLTILLYKFHGFSLSLLCD